MEKEYIDVEYTEVEEGQTNEEPKNITINTDPISATVSGIFSSVNNITNAVKEYNICKQQEQTKRTTIKAQMKVEIEKIHAQKEFYLECLEKNHEYQMFQIKMFYQKFEKSFKDVSDSIQAAIEIAKESKDFSSVCNLLEIERSILKESAEAELEYMKISQSKNSLQMENSIAGFLK